MNRLLGPPGDSVRVPVGFSNCIMLCRFQYSFYVFGLTIFGTPHFWSSGHWCSVSDIAFLCQPLRTVFWQWCLALAHCLASCSVTLGMVMTPPHLPSLPFIGEPSLVTPASVAPGDPNNNTVQLTLSQGSVNLSAPAHSHVHEEILIDTMHSQWHQWRWWCMQPMIWCNISISFYMVVSSFYCRSLWWLGFQWWNWPRYVHGTVAHVLICAFHQLMTWIDTVQSSCRIWLLPSPPSQPPVLTHVLAPSMPSSSPLTHSMTVPPSFSSQNMLMSSNVMAAHGHKMIVPGPFYQIPSVPSTGFAPQPGIYSWHSVLASSSGSHWFSTTATSPAPHLLVLVLLLPHRDIIPSNLN